MECKPAASSSTPESSCERIITEFQSNGRPTPDGSGTGMVLGGYEVMTPRVGTGFREWAVSGYDLEGKHANVPSGTRYNPHGDWLFDKTIAPTGVDTDEHNYRHDGEK